MNNYTQSLDSLNVGKYGCIDTIIKEVVLKLILKVSVIIEGITYVVKALKKQCVVYPNKKISFISWLCQKHI